MTSFEVVGITSSADFSPFRDEWLGLAHSLEDSSFFQSPDWAIAWWDTIAGRPETKVALWRDDGGSLEACAAVSRVSERLHSKVPLPVQFWTNTGSGIGAGDHLGFLATPDRAGVVRQWLDALDGSLLMRNVVADARYIPAEAVVTTTTACPRLSIPPGDDPIGRSTKYQKRLRRNSRILRERGLGFRAVDGPDITELMVTRLMEMHEVRSEDKSWGSTFTPERVEFHRQLITASDKGRGPGMMLATRDEEIVGVLYGFWWVNSFSYFQTGWDPEYWELSLGSALVYEMVLHARAEGATVFDFLRGSEEYKYRFGAEDRINQDWLVGWGASGKASAAKAKLH